MAAKNTMSTAAAKAVAKVKEQPAFNGKWGVGEHLSALRYIAVDTVRQAEANLNKWDADPANKGKTPPDLADVVNTLLRETFKADPELAYASNFQKLLVAAGEIKAEAKAGEEYA